MHPEPPRQHRVVPLDPAKDRVQELIQRWRTVSSAQGRAKSELDSIEAELDALLGDADVGTLNGEPVIERRAKKRPRLDVGRLRRDHPELADAYRSTDGNTELKFPRQAKDRPS